MGKICCGEMHGLKRLRPLFRHFGLIFGLLSCGLCAYWNGGVDAKRVDLPIGWSVVNNSSLPAFQASESVTPGSYRLIEMSENETFGLGFFDINGTGQYLFSVILGTKYRNELAGVLVWSANRNAPVSENSSLTITDQEELSLLDQHGSSIWLSPGPVAAIEMQESGNLALLNKTGDIIWQSFEHPTDNILPGQKLKGGTMLVSNSSHSTREGNFTLVIEPSGVVLYLNISNAKPQPYFLWSLQGSDVTSALQICNQYQAFVVYTGNGVNMNYELNAGVANTSAACAPPVTVSFPSPTGSQNALQRLNLESDGNLVSSHYDVGQSAWIRDFQLLTYFSDTCKFPMSCANYGVCLGNGECNCPQFISSNSTALDIKGFQMASTCPAVSTWQPQACTQNEVLNHHFHNLSGLSYFTNSYTKPDKLSALLEDCLSLCLSNCSCSAMFYNNQSRSCYFVDNVLGSLTIDPRVTDTVTAYLKFQNRFLISLPPSNSTGVKKKWFGRKQIIGISTGSLGLIAVLSIICYLVIQKKIKEKHSREQLQSGLSFPALKVMPRRFSLKELHQATKGFSCKLGSGGFGSVYEGILSSGEKIAVKKLESSNQGEKEFIAEVSAMGVISHVHIVKLCGFCAEGSNRLIVYEFMANGSLDRWLFRKGTADQDGFLDWKTRYQVALSTARGIAYLHEECREPILHLDIKPENILLDQQFEAKVSDFGMSKLLLDRDMSSVVTRVRGTPGYLAPEWLLNSVATKKCDVFSFGMLLLELVSGRRNIDTTKLGLESTLSWYFPAWAVSKIQASDSVMDLIEAQMRDSVSEEQVLGVIQVALWCIQENPSIRPTMESVVQMLEGHITISDPPLNFRFAVQTEGIVDITTSGSSMKMSYVMHSTSIITSKV
ncbi:hypothetical protein O6H91_01G047500 [Diphasiastrum complanatum]|uniref:Uncharacterized protein n=1 Tax=Diphasiastrum complanatum TaxID=34168 RepID=A0ACC2EQM9_DIPCM|nr:hypothetical protein O6H91_01G047500 [Diphasiastrum complanatum]